MNNHVTLTMVIQRINELGLKYKVLEIGQGLCVVVLERGARVFGPFESPESESLLWMNSMWLDQETFKNKIEEGEFDLGGERFWIEPEFAFFTKEKKRFHETYIVQASLDPGNYKLEEMQNRIRLFNTVNCDVFEFPIKEKSFTIEKEIRSLPNPLRYVRGMQSLIQNVKYGGYEISATIVDTSPQNEIPLGPWFIAQINPGGYVYVPIQGEFEYVDFYEPLTEEYQTFQEGYAKLKITGDRRYKPGYRSAQTTGRFAYMNETDKGETYAIVRNYFNDPSQDYCAEPFEDLGNFGCSVYFYNDSGKLGGFSELESAGIPIDGKSGKTQGTSTIDEWFFIGQKDHVTQIVNTLLGTSIR